MNVTAKWIIGLSIVIALGAYVVLGDIAREDTQGESIVIGFIAPLTGDASVYGIPKRNTVELAVSEINKTGGVDGHLLRVIYEDGKCTGGGAVDAAHRLVDVKEVEVIIGGFCSNESVSAEPITTANDIFLVSAGSSSPDLTDVSPLFARTYPSDASQGAVLANAAFERGWRKIAFIQEQLDYPLGIYRAFAQRFETLGGAVVVEEFQATETEFLSYLMRLQVTNPDALFIDTQTAASASRVVEQITELEWEVPLLISDAPATDLKFTSAYAEFLEGALAAVVDVDSNNEIFQHLKTQYEMQYGSLPYANYMQVVYDTVYLLADGIADVGYDATALAAWVRETEGWSGASGVVDIGENGDRLGGHHLKSISDGMLVNIQ
ncbi:ABC transporter substrate-binding protein [Candidatus Kaiserbacteria bacterium]|nr:ABC transporter substrate-binding protein [Candidatus Kaiserbacteria bacterium]